MLIVLIIVFISICILDYIEQIFTSKHDNAGPIVARFVHHYLEEFEIADIVWPSKIPNLNAVEKLWNKLG